MRSDGDAARTRSSIWRCMRSTVTDALQQPIHSEDRRIALEIFPVEVPRDPDDRAAVAKLKLRASAIRPLELREDQVFGRDDRDFAETGMVDGGSPIERAPRPGVVPPEHEIDADDLDPMHESADPPPSDIDSVIDQEVAFTYRSNATLVVDGVEVEDEIEVACHPRLGVNGQCPGPGHVEPDLEPCETVQNVPLDIHASRMRLKSEVGGLPW